VAEKVAPSWPRRFRRKVRQRLFLSAFAISTLRSGSQPWSGNFPRGLPQRHHSANKFPSRFFPSYVALVLVLAAGVVRPFHVINGTFGTERPTRCRQSPTCATPSTVLNTISGFSCSRSKGPTRVCPFPPHPKASFPECIRQGASTPIRCAG
jgi:hypothetical protein